MVPVLGAPPKKKLTGMRSARSEWARSNFARALVCDIWTLFGARDGAQETNRNSVNLVIPAHEKTGTEKTASRCRHALKNQALKRILYDFRDSVLRLKCHLGQTLRH